MFFQTDTILEFIEAIAQPLSVDLIFIVIIAGILFGLIYNRSLKLPSNLIYHKFITGAAFGFFIFGYKSAVAFMGGWIIPNPASWIGIGMLWAIFCMCIWVGSKIKK